MEMEKSPTAMIEETVIVWLAVARTLFTSVTESVTVKCPAVAYAWLGDVLVLLVPSPKFHAYEYGVVPPLTVEVKVTLWLIVGEEGLKTKSAVNANGEIVIV